MGMNGDKGLVERLKACPFCGANEEGFRLAKTGCPKIEELEAGGWRITCYTCRYSIGWEPFPTLEAAIAAWNTRTEPSTIPEEGLVERVRGVIHRVMDQRPFVRMGQDTVDELAYAMAALAASGRASLRGEPGGSIGSASGVP